MMAKLHNDGEIDKDGEKIVLKMKMLTMKNYYLH